MRLSALIANHASGAYALGCVASLRRAWAEAGCAPEDLEVVVCDDASPAGEEPSLASLEAGGARVLRQPHNRGYGASIASALEQSSGAREDWVAVLNADLEFLPGSLTALCARMRSAGAKEVLAPRQFSDPSRALFLPHHRLPSAGEQLQDQAACVSPQLARRRADQRARRSIEAWSRTEPSELEMLSGAALFLRRDTLQDLGPLFDPRYPMYFEDSDLCRRLRASGVRLLELPAAHLAHYWARSSGIGKDFERRVGERFRASRRAYLERWHGRLARLAVEAGERILQGLPTSLVARALHPFEDLGTLDAPCALRWSRETEVLVELGMGATMALAAGTLHAGNRWDPGVQAWSHLFAGRYFVRVLERTSLSCLGAWTFVKAETPVQPHWGEESQRAAVCA